MKKALLAFLAIIVLFGIMPVAISAADEVGYAESYVDATGSYKRLEALMERGAVNSTYDLTYSSNHYNSCVRTAYDVKTGGAARMSVEKISVSHGTIYIQFFASDYTKISSVAYTIPNAVNIPADCDFIRIEIHTAENLEKVALRFYDCTGAPREAKRFSINEVSERLTYKVSEDVHTTSRLMLPPNYSIDGEKVPLILWLEGSGSGLSTWNGDFNSNKLPYLQYLRDEGFAVFSVYAWGNEYAEKYPGCGKSFPYPIPINLACIKAGIEYICDRYNIDPDNIHIMSKSQGGQCALYYASCNELNVKTIGMFAPVLDYLSMPGEAMYKDTRAAIADEMNFTGDVAYFASDRFLSYSDEGRAFLKENLDKLLLFNEAWTNLTGATPEELFEASMDDCKTFWTEEIWKTNRTDIYTNTDLVKTASVPVKIWGAQDDAATPYLKMVEVVMQLKNGGAVADLRTMPNGTGAHSCADTGSTRVDVTTALGIEHKSVPIGWVENIQWIRSNGSVEDTHTHYYEKVVTPPTNTEQGYTTYTCLCGNSYISDYVAAVGSYKQLRVLLERGSVSSTYDLGYTSEHYNGYVRTAYDIRTGGAARVSIEQFEAVHGSIYIQFFASDYAKISSISYTQQAVVNIPDNCDFIRIEIRTAENLEEIMLRFYGGADDPKEVKRASKNAVSEKLTYKVSEDVHTTSRLMLPPNYSIDGEKVPLILWLEGSGSGLSAWGGDFNQEKLPYLKYLRDEGFAVFSVYAWGNQYAEKYPNCGQSFPYPVPTNLACIKAGIEYICDRYNIDPDNIHIMSKSQGGQCALYYASCNELNVKTIGMFAPVLDYLSMPGEARYKDTRAAIAEDLEFTGDVAYFASDRFLSYSDEGRAFLRENLSKLLTMNEAWTNLSGATPEELFEAAMDDCETFWTEEIWKTNRTDIYTNTDLVKTASVPVKIWGAKDDAATPYLKMVEVVAQLKNGGSVAELRTLTGGHSCADTGSIRVDVTTALGIEHKNIPIGWVENIQWIRSNGVPFAAGDVDGDRAVSYNDAIYLLLHTMFGAEYPLNGAHGDIDGNGTIDQDDAVYLLLHTLFGGSFYPLAKN